MPKLTLSYENETLNTYLIKEGEVVRIGRSDQNEIVLDESAVSGIHAEIEFDGDGFYITDIQSKNGTFVDGELVISRKLHHGNVISVGDYTIAFEYKEGEDRREKSLTSVSEATMMLDTSTHRAKLAKSLSEIGEYQKKTTSQAMLAFLDDAHPPLSLDKPITTIGKDSSCDIVVKGFLIAKTAAEIHRKQDGFYIKSAGGAFNPKVNYKPLKSEMKLNDFDVIEIGSTKLQFHFQIT